MSRFLRPAAVATALALSLLAGLLVPRVMADGYIASTWTGAWGSPALSVSASCRSAGRQAVWAAETGTRFLDIIQIGTVNGRYFAAWGNGAPNGAGSSYVQRDLGRAAPGRHAYRVSLASRVWSLSIDGRVRVRVADTFRHWRLRASQVMAEGDLPLGHASCRYAMRDAHTGGYGPQPRTLRLGNGWWSV